eukprot:2393468-Pyramimonas_sp.AAC.1
MTANKLVRCCESAWASCKRMRVPFTVENAAVSLGCGSFRLCRAVESNRIFFWAVTHLCQGGTAWNKNDWSPRLSCGCFSFRSFVHGLSCVLW